MEIVISEGFPERKIVAFNEQKPHDLIIMRGLRRLDYSHALGHSVKEEVIAEASCPVLVLGGAIIPGSAGLTELRSQQILTQNDQSERPQIGG
jgi:hypothetical protein